MNKPEREYLAWGSVLGETIMGSVLYQDTRPRVLTLVPEFENMGTGLLLRLANFVHR